MKILYVTSEALPFVSSGGLADVSGSLPGAVNKITDFDIRVVLPLYKSVKENFEKELVYLTNFTVTLSWRRLYCGVFVIEKNGVKYYFLDNEYYFLRDSVYGDFDDGERFAFFSKAVLDLMNAINFFPNVLHANDWQSALSVVYLKKIYINDSRYKNVKTIFTIHNIMYQGRYNENIFSDIVGLPEYCKEDVMQDGDINFMKGAIQTADTVTTVSPSYKEELLRGENSYQMEYILNRRRNEFLGIVNGIDTEFYNPTNNDIYKKYQSDFNTYKSENKIHLQKETGLYEDAEIPVLSIISRLCKQKGVDIMKSALENVLSNTPVQLIVLGKGDYMEEEFFKYLQSKYPDKVRCYIKFDKDMSKRIYAGSDIFLMPSLTEPCGIAQMIACRYGTVPVVRETGGLRDTIKCYNPHDEKETCGFTFYDYNSDCLKDTIYRALELYKDKNKWQKLSLRAMNYDFSWEKSARLYSEVYKR